MRTHRRWLLFLAVSICSLAQADTIYTYTGTPFTFAEPASGLTTSDFISLTMVFANPIAPNTGIVGDLASNTPTSLVSVTPNAFSATDGLNTLDNNSPQVSDDFFIATDSSGNIGAWNILVSQQQVRSGVSGHFDLGTDNFIVVASPGLQRIDHSCFERAGLSDCFDTAATTNGGPLGSWTVTTTTSSVPEPSSVALFPSGLATVLSLNQIRKRRYTG